MKSFAPAHKNPVKRAHTNLRDLKMRKTDGVGIFRQVLR
jgi:hypothetical protein